MKTNLTLRLFLAIPACFLTHCLFFIMQSQQFFSVSVVELTQWTILIALFSQSVPPSCVCYCRTGGYAGHGGNADPAESEHFLSNNLKFCRLMGGGGLQSMCFRVGVLDTCRWSSYKVPDHQVCHGM